MPSTVKTGFLEGPHGKLYVSLFLPSQATPLRSCVIHAPAFAEEMNKSRPMVSRQARSLAERGTAVVVPDLSGTGDSEGEISDATWTRWKTDLIFLVDWSHNAFGVPTSLWGVRLGCLLALDVIGQIRQPVRALLMWQPVLNGKQHMAQFLRLRMATGLMHGEGESVAQLRERLLNEGQLEVAGYALSSQLLTEVEAVVASQLEVPPHVELGVLEIVGDPGKSLLPVTKKQVDHWVGCHIDCAAHTVAGSPFWMTQEIALATGLIEPGCRFLAGATPEADKPEVSYPDIEKMLAAQALPTAASTVRPVVFSCDGEELVGQLHVPGRVSAPGVLIVVGGPQYRVGSHRQFVHLARHLCEQGVPVFRFDYRGMGDSSGELHGFTSVHQDIKCAVDAFQRECDVVSEIVIWGLCDAATAAIAYAHSDPRVKGLILANPWVYSKQGAAKAYLKHYYLRRFFSMAFWRKVVSGNFKPVDSASSVVKMVGGAMDNPGESDSPLDKESGSPEVKQDLVTQFSAGLNQFKGDVLVILSGDDLTAAEFKDAIESNRTLRRLMQGRRVSTVALPESDHTFSRREWSNQVEKISSEMIFKLRLVSR